jgi:ankyrin repeat protein
MPEGNPVCDALRERDLAKACVLLDTSPSLLYTGDRASNQPIHWAVMSRNIAAIDALLNRGAHIDAKRKDGARPIHLTNGDYNYRGWRDVPKDVATTPAEVLDHLIAKGAFVDFWTASHRGDIERVRELLDQDPSLANRNSDYNSYYLGSGSALRNAAANGHIEVVKLLLERGADPNLPEEHIAPHGHALYSAVYNRHHDIARLLLAHGAIPNVEVESSADTLSIAIGNKDGEMVELLCAHGAARRLHLLAYYGDVKTAAAVFAANPSLADDVEALSNAAGGGHESFVRLMLRYQPKLAGRLSCDGGKTPQMTQLLKQHGWNPSLPGWLGIAPLHDCARRGKVDRAALLLDLGADIEARDEDICSRPLAWAAKFGQLAMVEFLLARGAQRRTHDDPPWATPLAWAERRGHNEVAGILK